MRRTCRSLLVGLALLLPFAGLASAQQHAPRPRDLGVPFPGSPGTNNAITDVKGVEVGQSTLIRGDDVVAPGTGAIRTGVTVIHPLGKASIDAVAAGFAVINGTGEFTGTRMVDETGLLLGPIGLTGTANIPTVSQSFMNWAARPGYLPKDQVFTHFLPVVAETLDARLTDILKPALTEKDVFAALDGAASGPVAEGNVGGGTGMQAYRFKGGIGTASRVVKVKGDTYTVGVLLQANNGRRTDLRIAGVPVGEAIKDLLPGKATAPDTQSDKSKNSLLVIIAVGPSGALHHV